MQSTLTIAEGTLTIQVAPGRHDTYFAAPGFYPWLKVTATIKTGRTFDLSAVRELCRTSDDETAADLVRNGIPIRTDGNGTYYWRTPPGSQHRAATAAGNRAGYASWAKLDTIIDRECSIFHDAEPGWEQYSLRLTHIASYQAAVAALERAKASLEQAIVTAGQIREKHHITDAEALLKLAR